MKKTATIIILIVGLLVLAALAIPLLVTPRTTSAQNACVNNLRLIQVAKTRWAQIYHKGPSDTPKESDLFSEAHDEKFSEGTGYDPGAFKRMPPCPAGTNYTYIIGALNEEPRCTTGWKSHSLQWDR